MGGGFGQKSMSGGMGGMAGGMAGGFGQRSMAGGMGGANSGTQGTYIKAYTKSKDHVTITSMKE